MATLPAVEPTDDPAPPSHDDPLATGARPSGHEPGRVRFVAATDLNLAWTSPRGHRNAIAGPPATSFTTVRTGVPAGQPFSICACCVDAFERWAAPSPGNANVSAAAQDGGRIPGLRRLED